MEACELLPLERRLDQIEAELARELPGHMRDFALAYARGEAAPAAPRVLVHAETLAIARAALPHVLLADRGLALLRLAGPLAIEADDRVAAARAVSPTWDALIALAAARGAAAATWLGRGALDALHRLHGVSPVLDDGAGVAPALPPLPPPVPRWFAPDGIALGDREIERVWTALSARHGVTGTVRFERSERARPRTFVVQPRREVVVVVAAQIATPAERFAVLHELGHAIAALALPAGIPRVVDEAAAAYVARAIERPSGGIWYSAAAGAARARRHLLARVLDRTERQIERAIVTRSAIADPPAERPPWALWHDPGAQAAYAAAEILAGELDHDLGARDPGALPDALAALRDAIDRRAVLFDAT
jgi:hypothetical protein